MPNIVSKYLIDKSDNAYVQFLRYAVVGSIATIADIGIFIFFSKILEIHYLIAAALGFIIGVAVNYILTVLWVFESTGNVKKELFWFVVIGLGGLIWTEILMWILVERFGFDSIIAKIFTILTVLMWNFLMRKYFVFKKS